MAEYLADWARDLRYASRVLLKAKASTAAVVVILTLAIGANTSVFTLLDRVLFQPLPVPDPSRLVLVTNWERVIPTYELTNVRTFSYTEYSHLRDRNNTLSGLAAEADLAIREHRPHQRVDHPAVATAVSGNFFRVLGVTPYLGRGLIDSDDVRGGASHVAVASYRFWSRRFNGSSDVLGSTVYLKNVPFTVVGVLHEEFHGVEKGYDPDLYVPLGSLQELFDFEPLTRSGVFQLFGRLRPGVSPVQAQSNLQVLSEQYLNARISSAASQQQAEEYRKEFADDRIELRDGSAGYAGTEGEKRTSLMLLSVIVGLLLLIGCANVACLLLARGVARRREIAICLSLGASRRRILRQSLMESFLLSLAGGATGVVAAYWVGRLLLIAFQWKDRPIELAPDLRVLGFGLAVSLVTGVLVGAAPALQLLGGGQSELLAKSAAPRLMSGRALVVLEMALSLVLVAGAAMFTRSFQNLRSVPVGFSAEQISVVRLAPLDRDGADTIIPERDAMRLAEWLRRSPAVESVGLTDTVMFNDSYMGVTLAVSGVPRTPGRTPHLIRADQGYLDTLRIRLLAGRAFDARDDERSPKVAILSENVARRLFPNQRAIGKTILLRGVETQVVGIVNDAKSVSVSEPSPEVVYIPWLQGWHDNYAVTFEVRSSLTPRTVAAMLGLEIRAERLPAGIESATTLDDEIMESMRGDRLRMQGSSVFSGLALLLIVVGIYGLMAYSVVRRTREIGIRVAVGSTPNGIVRLILNESLRLVGAGVIVGIPGAIALMKATSSMVFGLSPVDSASLAIAALVLAVVGIAASAVPAWRAARLDPVSALHVE